MTKCFIQLVRSEDTSELLKRPREFMLLALIAYRAKRTASFSALGLEPGEALIGDHKSCGLTERGYRTAKKNLEKWGFATFKPTNKGTVARLINSIVFDINCETADEQTDDRPTTDRRASDEQATTNNKDKKENKENKSPAAFQKEGAGLLYSGSGQYRFPVCPHCGENGTNIRAQANCPYCDKFIGG